MESQEDIISELKDKYIEKLGVFCLNCLIQKARFAEIEEFLETNDIDIPEVENPSKYDYLKYIISHFYEIYNSDPKVQSKFENPLEYAGRKIIENEKLNHYLTRFDFFAKQDLVDAFSDWCADLGISVYDTSEVEGINIDLYLLRRTPLLRTETVLVRTGATLNKEEYKNTFYLINEASKIATWTVFVTTPLGIYNIGMDRLVSDMENLDTWLYVVDPLHKNIWGITKGSKGKNYDSDARDKYIEKLPKEPIRAPSKIKKISDYKFNDDISYKTKKFGLFGIYTEDEMEEIEEEVKVEHKYRDIFRNIMVIAKDTGLPLISFSSEDEPLDKVLISGFLTAMDNFISEIGGESAMKEINYKGLYVQAAYGKDIKTALFLSEPADKSLKERLSYLVSYVETHYKDEIRNFIESGRTAMINEKKFVPILQEIIDI